MLPYKYPFISKLVLHVSSWTIPKSIVPNKLYFWIKLNMSIYFVLYTGMRYIAWVQYKLKEINRTFRWYVLYYVLHFYGLHSVFDFPFSDKIITQDQKTVIVNFVNSSVCHLNPWSSKYLRVLHNIHSCQNWKRSWFEVANQSIQTHNRL